MIVEMIVRAPVIIAAAAAMLAAPNEPLGTTRTQVERTEATVISELWVDPGDIAQRDAFHGGGADNAPPTDGVYEVQAVDVTGYSRGFTVADVQGRIWDVKIGAEAQTELVASRVLWLIGYHQPVTYFVPSWQRKGQESRRQQSGRFRLQSDHQSADQWDWTANPFVGTRELKGLVVVNLVLNNWDFKASNNRIYTFAEPVSGPSRWFVVQDLGASLGATGWPIGTRNDVEAFESQRFVTIVNGELQFGYRGRHRELMKDLTVEDVLWTCRLLDRISDQQWRDIFRAAAYPEAVSARYRAHLEAKIAEGLALAGESGVKP